MLAEPGIALPRPHGEEDSINDLLLMLGYCDLPFRNFEGPFYVRMPCVGRPRAAWTGHWS